MISNGEVQKVSVLLFLAKIWRKKKVFTITRENSKSFKKAIRYTVLWFNLILVFVVFYDGESENAELNTLWCFGNEDRKSVFLVANQIQMTTSIWRYYE